MDSESTKHSPSKSNLSFIAANSNYGTYHNGKRFTGVKESFPPKDYKYIRETYVDGKRHGVRFTLWKNSYSIYVYTYNECRYAFKIQRRNSQESNFEVSTVYDWDTLDLIIDYKIVEDGRKRHQESFYFDREDLDYDKKIKESSEILQLYLENRETFYQLGLFAHSYSNSNNPFNLTKELNEARIGKSLYAYLIQESMNELLGHTVADEFMEKYVLENEIAKKIINEDQIQYLIKYIAGVSVAYNDINQKMVTAIVVLDVETKEIVDQAFSESEDITIHIPDLFAYNEVPLVIKAFEKLTIKPQLFFCDGHGIEHPKNVGLATILGIELDIPAIGCPQKRLVGYYKKSSLETHRGATEELWFDDQIVGKALRTQENNNPLYVSIGHKISLDTAIEWVLKTTQNTTLPIVISEAIKITEEIMPERVRYDFLDDRENINGIIL
ncbi:endonuclease V [Flavobacterium procerum]|uniref:Endonuclease V n=1 Tax=Flavobacterium procerum TaxID=1455569 RepID=A0ABV6BSQ5_9FLAO